MKQLKELYAFENELMEIVPKGLTHRAEELLSSVSPLSYQKRLADPLRNTKNHCIIFNTLFRKLNRTAAFIRCNDACDSVDMLAEFLDTRGRLTTVVKRTF